MVNKLNNDYDRIALFGHNPGLTDFINYLADAHVYNLPTAAVSVIDFPFDDWLLTVKLGAEAPSAVSENVRLPVMS